VTKLGVVVGGVTFLGAATIGWQYRSQFVEIYRDLRGRSLGEIFEEGPGAPSPEALESAQHKQVLIARMRGPDSVALNTQEMASLIVEGLDPKAREALDSLTVEFGMDRFTLQAQLVTAMWGRESLGFFSAFLLPREPLRVSGPVRVERPGVIAWVPDQFSIRSIPFPQAAIRPIVNSLTGRRDGAFFMGAPPTIGSLLIRPASVTFYRGN
jgi:hypothetical protein